MALENARLFRDNGRRVDELSVLHELSRAVTGRLDRAGLIVDHPAAGRASLRDATTSWFCCTTRSRDKIEVALRTAGGVADLACPAAIRAAAWG